MRPKSKLLLLAALVFLALLLYLSAVVQRAAPAAQPTPAPARTAAPEATPSRRSPSPMAGKLRIAELMEKNKSTVQDEDGDFPDWIELWNCSDETVDLTGWRLADGEKKEGWELPALRLEPDGRAVIFASRKDRRGDELHTDFAVSAEERIFLRDGQSMIVDTADCGGCDSDVSMALAEDGSWAASTLPTPGYENTRAGYEAFAQTLRPVDALVIYELMPSNLGAVYTGMRSDCDWVEIKNVSDEPVTLSDYYLSDTSNDLYRCRLPEQTLRPGSMAVLICESGADFVDQRPSTGFGLHAGEALFLTRADGRVVDRVRIPDVPSGGSCGRMDGQGGFFLFASPSFGRDNTDGKRFLAATPVSLTADGVFDGVDSVAVTLSGEGTIRYTLDGSAPGETSPVYDGPVELTETCVLRARSFADDSLPSRPLTLSFILNEGHSLPVVSLVSDSLWTFNMMYDAGQRGVELPGAVSLYRDGKCFTLGCGIAMNGETSLSEFKKNMALRFRACYGQETLQYDIYGGGATEFTNLLLRAGQDQDSAIIRNELAQALADTAQAKVVNQRSIWCVLYVNGKYRGLYTLKEKANEQLYASREGIDRDSVELVEAAAPLGSDFEVEVIEPAYTDALLTAEGYAELCERVDMDSFIDWLILEGFCSNTDVTMGNVRYVRSGEADGKWHFMFYDLDAAFRATTSQFTNLMTPFSADHIQIAAPVLKLMQNPAFKERFLTRAAQLMRTSLTNEEVLAEIDRQCAIIAPEVARDRKQLERTEKSWQSAVQNLKALITEEDWRQSAINSLVYVFELSADERALYFGDIDKLAPERS